ncbi:MAG: hypothetical protein IKO36_01595 [Bacteroidaceae bacterium]|nr:hypothetical protein [Bacteroidaceae bacterium]
MKKFLLLMSLCLPVFTFASSNNETQEKEESEGIINPDYLTGEWWLVKLRVREKIDGKVINDSVGNFPYKKELDSSEKHRFTLNKRMIFTDECLTYDSILKKWNTLFSNRVFLKKNDNKIYLSEYDDFREKILKLDSDELVIEGTDFQGTYNYVKIYKRVKQQMA